MIVIANLALTAVLLVVVLLLAWRSRPDKLVGSTVVAHTKSGESFRAVVHANHADRLTLREVVLLADAKREVAIPQLVHIPRDNLGWLQTVDAAGLLEPAKAPVVQVPDMTVQLRAAA